MRWIFVIAGAAALAGCGGTDKSQNEEIETSVSSAKLVDDSRSVPVTAGDINPADRPGAIVYRPTLDTALRFIEEKKQVLDPRTGDRLYLRGPHGDGKAQYGLMDSNFKIIVMGGYYKYHYTENGQKWVVVYDIVSTRRWEPGAPESTPEEMDISRIAPFIRVYQEAFSKGADVETVVFDSRRTRSP